MVRFVLLIFMLGLYLAQAQTCTWPVVKEGSAKSTYSFTVQYFLNALDYSVGTVDGIIGSKSVAAIEAMQKAAGLTVDGEVGALGWGTMMTLLMIQTAESTNADLISASQYNLNITVNGQLDSATTTAIATFKQNRGLTEAGQNSPLYWLALLQPTCQVVPAGAYGLDLSVYQGNVTLSSWQCLHDAGFSYAIIQAQRSNTEWNEYAASDVMNAQKAGFTDVGVYLFLDFDQPASQVTTTIQLIQQYNMNVSTLWFDIEGSKDTPVSQNQQFLADCATIVTNAGYELALYISPKTWTAVFGDLTGYGKLRQWYAHYDGVPAFYDFTPFSDFTVPYQKQFLGTTNLCSTQLDVDFRQLV